MVRWTRLTSLTRTIMTILIKCMESIAMKKNTIVLGCVLCAFTLFSCQKEENNPNETTPKETIPAEAVDEDVPAGYSQLTLSAVSDDTKTTLDGTTVKWKTEDQIKVYCSDGTASDFTLVGEGGSATGSFAGLVPSGKTALYAIYPNDLYSSVSETSVNVTIPATQDGVFGNANVAVAKIDAETLDMAFKNVNAFIGFTIPAGITKVIVSSVGDSGNLSGTLAVDCSGETPVAGSLSNGGASITVTFPESAGGAYYVAVAPGITHSKGLLLEWYKGSAVSGTYWLNKGITTAAGSVYDMGSVSAEGDYYVSVDGAGSKSGMNWANAWSASQLWAKLHPAGSDADIDGAKLANIDGATFHLAAGTYNWGGSPSISINETATIGFTLKGGYNASTGERNIASNPTIFTGDDDEDGTGDHRILILDGNMDLAFDGITFTKGYTSGSGDNGVGGGIWIKNGSSSFKDCTFSENNAVHGGALRFDSTGDLMLNHTTFSDNTVSGDGGALSLKAGNVTSQGGSSFTDNSASDKSSLGGAIDCFGSANLIINAGSFSGNSAASGGAIAVESGATVQLLTPSSKTFIGNSATSNGGALYIDSRDGASEDKDVKNKINNVVFKGNTAKYGGAVAINGQTSCSSVIFSACTIGGTQSGEPNYASQDGGAIYANNLTYVNLGSSNIVGNYVANTGGAICVLGQATFKLFRDSFISNHADNTGGALFAKNISAGYPDIFIDECSFDANYIATNYGCAFNIAAANSFIMHSSSIRDSYITSSKTGEKACWIDFDGIQSCTSISNCSIIGDAASSALVWACSGSWTNYFTNNIITSSSSSTGSIHSDGSALDLSYNHIYNATSFTDNGGNVNGVLSADIDGLDWSNTGSSSYYWKWDGTFNSAAPSQTNKTDVNSRVNTASSAFVSWSGSDFDKDQRGVGRGNSDWWPGAYQEE